jgi:hypothetical protein
MLSSVHLDNHAFFQTNKIHDVTAQRLLPPEFVAVKLPQAELAPKHTLAVGRVISKFSGSLSYSVQFPPILTFPRNGGKVLQRLMSSLISFSASATPLLLLMFGASQCQLLIHLIHRTLGVRAVLAGQGAATRMMRDFHQRQAGDPEELRFGPTQLHENRLAQSNRRFTALLQFDRVVDTPRRARPSSAQAGDHGVAPADKLLHNWFRRTLHVRWFCL